jgi:hypothetical protein
MAYLVSYRDLCRVVMLFSSVGGRLVGVIGPS